jgi:hypothetical protein
MKAIVEQQHGYHEQYNYLIPMQHLFFWRYYAGVCFAILVYALFKVGRRTLQYGKVDDLTLTILLLTTMSVSPTHLIIKARPYLSVPYSTHKVWIPVFGLTFLISYLLMLAWRRWQRKWAVLLVVGVWGIILYGALTRPAYLGFLSAQVGINYRGPGPDPMKTLLEMLSNLWIQVLYLFGAQIR